MHVVSEPDEAPLRSVQRVVPGSIVAIVCGERHPYINSCRLPYSTLCGLSKPESLTVLPICELTLTSIFEFDSVGANTCSCNVRIWPCKRSKQGFERAQASTKPMNKYKFHTPHPTPSTHKTLHCAANLPRALSVVIVRSAEAPRDLTNDEINAQLPSLARVLTAGYRRQVRRPMVSWDSQAACNMVLFTFIGTSTGS